MPSPRLTLSDLAARLKVSATTISNAFNRPDQLSRTLRERILTEAAALGFSGPDETARSLRTGKTFVIGVVLPESLSWYFEDAVASQFLGGVSQVLDAAGYRLLLLPETSLGDGRRVPAVDGVIIYGVGYNGQLATSFQQQGKPVVGVEVAFPDTPTVLINDEQTTYEITRWSLANTPSRYEPLIVSLHVERWQHSTDLPALAQSRRLNAMHRALREAGHDPAMIPVVDTHDITHSGLEKTLPAWLRQGEPRLLLCMSDSLALTALELVEQYGLKVPEDIRLTGFDGINEGQRRSPQLTTVYQDSRGKGASAARMVLGTQSCQQLTLDGFLIYGESCPPPEQPRLARVTGQGLFMSLSADK